MSKRPVLPPSVRVIGESTTDTLEVLQSRLSGTESDTQLLARQLKELGFKPDNHRSHHPESFFHVEYKSDTIVPSKEVSPPCDYDATQSYDGMVSRVCKLESVIHSLKSSVLRLQSSQEVIRKEKDSATEHLAVEQESHAQEVRTLNQDLALLKQKCLEAVDGRKRAEEKVSQIEASFGEVTLSAASLQMDTLKSTNQKLVRQLKATQGELNHETSLRQSLEESHNTLLQRVQEMESVVEGERSEVAALNTTCTALRKESVSSQAELRREQQQHIELEQNNNRLKQLTDSKDVKIASTEKDKQTLMSELGRMRDQYTMFNSQLDSMKKELTHRLSNEGLHKKETAHLKDAIKSAATENAQLIVRYEHELEVVRMGMLGRLQEEVSVSQLREQLKEECHGRTRAQATCSQTEKELSCLRSRLDEVQGQMESKVEVVERKSDTLRGQLKNAQDEKEQIMSEKDALLDEVSQAVDAMTEEKNRLDVQLTQATSEVTSLRNTTALLEQERAALRQRVSSLEGQQNRQVKVSASLSDILEQKSVLAYDNGRLHRSVEQLQQDLESCGAMKAELGQLRKSHKTLEAKYSKSESELRESNKKCELLQTHSNQVTESTQSRGKDLELVIESRDRVVADNQKMQSEKKLLNEAHIQKVEGLQKNLFAAEVDTRRVTETLESVMQSHQQLQLTVERQQTELGHKDAAVSLMTTQIADRKQTAQRLKKQVAALRHQISGMETAGVTEMVPLRTALEKCKEDNVSLSEALDEKVRRQEEMESKLQVMGDDLERKSHLLKELRIAREKETVGARRDVTSYEARLANLRDQMAKEREKAVRKTSKDVTETRRQLENSLSRNSELSKQNSTLKHQITELETDLRETRVRLASQRSQIDHLAKTRRKQDEELHKLQGLSQQLSQLEKVKNEYVKKIKDQSKTTEEFVTQISSLQTETQLLVKSQVDMTEFAKTQQGELEKVLSLNEELETRCQDLVKKERSLEKLHKDMEKKLLETNIESIQISSNLQDTHKWFKSKFGHLHEDINCRAKVQQLASKEAMGDVAPSHKDMNEVEETTEKAKAMIQASRETISQLADYATRSQTASNNELHAMQEKLESERSRAIHMETKLKTFQESSLRYTEELARELDYLKQLSTTSCDSS